MDSTVSKAELRSLIELPRGCEVYLGEAIRWIASGRGVPASWEAAELALIAKCATGEVVASGHPEGADAPHHEVIDKTVWRAGTVSGKRTLHVSTIDRSLGSELGGVVSLTYEDSTAIWKTWESVGIPVEQVLDAWPPIGSFATDWADELPDFRDQRSLLIEAVEAGNMFLPEAEKVAAENGLQPLSPAADPAAFPVMHMDDWTAEMVMAWIIWRNPLNVVHFYKPFHQNQFAVRSPFDQVSEPDLDGIRHRIDWEVAIADLDGKERQIINYEAALEELLNALQRGEINADGTKLRTMDTETIGAREWRRLTLIHDGELGTVAANNLGLPIYADILISSSQVVRIWPGAGNSSETDANSLVGTRRQSAMPGEKLKSIQGSAAPASIRMDESFIPEACHGISSPNAVEGSPSDGDDEEIPTARNSKRARVKPYLLKMFPNGIPTELSDTRLHQLVADAMDDAAKKNPLLEKAPSRETILRAAARK